MDSPGSPLSETLSDVPPSIRSLSATPEPEVRPTKRQRISTGGSAAARRASGVKNKQKDLMEHLDDTAIGGFPSDVDISSDTEGSVSGSVHGLPMGMDDEDDKAAAGGKEQISICRWEDCDAGDQGNMDLLVKHLHEEHIHARQKKYSCEWIDCSRKGHPHASGYALRAHMRSHTREKPFYCTLPECDRSFTRSDALAKHMRTVHETEALRPSDPVPKHHSSNPTNKVQRIRLTFNKFAAGMNGTKEEEPVTPSKRKTPEDTSLLEPMTDYDYGLDNATWTRNETTGEWKAKLPEYVEFEDEERDELAPQQLYALMKKQIEWALAERDELDQQLYSAEKRRKGEWIAKEMVLADALALAQAAAPIDEEANIGTEAQDVEDEDVLMESKSRNGDDDETMMHPETSPPPADLLPPLPYSNPHPAMSVDSNDVGTNGRPIASEA